MNQKLSKDLQKILSSSHEETFNTGKIFAEQLSPGDVVGLNGELGSGKTVFVKGVCNYFDVSEEVSSPTFIIINQYEGKFPGSNEPVTINHFDLYRLSSAADLRSIDFFSYLNGRSICLIEWPAIAVDLLDDITTVTFKHGSKENERILNLP